tara:strand:+ start:832 stop:1062 length:231 start_codon:yes stop_codon:yes gene_type:complete
MRKSYCRLCLMANSDDYEEDEDGTVNVHIPKDEMWKVPVYDNIYDLTRHAIDFHKIRFGSNMDYELQEELAEAGYA